MALEVSLEVLEAVRLIRRYESGRAAGGVGDGARRRTITVLAHLNAVQRKLLLKIIETVANLEPISIGSREVGSACHQDKRDHPHRTQLIEQDRRDQGNRRHVADPEDVPEQVGTDGFVERLFGGEIALVSVDYDGPWRRVTDSGCGKKDQFTTLARSIA